MSVLAKFVATLAAAKLRTAAHGTLVVTSLHQPAAIIFERLDRVCILSLGLTVYFGPVDHMREHFEAAGAPCPQFHNPADHCLYLVNIDFEASALASSKRSASKRKLNKGLPLVDSSLGKTG